MDATTRDNDIDPLEPLTIGVDVGGKGNDETVIIAGHGHVIVPYTKDMPIFAINEMDPTQIAWKVEGCIADYLESREGDGKYAIAVDGIGVGAGVASHLSRQAQLSPVFDVNVGEMAAEHDRFHWLRDEIWWMAREAFSNRLISIPNEADLIAQLTDIHYEDESGKIKVEGKKELKKRGVASPNKADAFCLREYARRYCTSRVPRKDQRQHQPVRAGHGPGGEAETRAGVSHIAMRSHWIASAFKRC
jgi:hypothetical protein